MQHCDNAVEDCNSWRIGQMHEKVRWALVDLQQPATCTNPQPMYRNNRQSSFFETGTPPSRADNCCTRQFNDLCNLYYQKFSAQCYTTLNMFFTNSYLHSN